MDPGGRQGEGPGEFLYAELLRGCTNAESVVVYDIWNVRVTGFSGEGDLVLDYPFTFEGLPARDVGCAPNGRLVFAGSGTGADELGIQAEEVYREAVPLAFAEQGNTEATVIREGIPGAELEYMGDPGNYAPGSIWPHGATYAATDDGVWLGTGDDYEVEFLDWTGTTTRRIRWEGPELAVSQEDIDSYRDNLRDRYASGSDPNWRARFESVWEWQSGLVPSSFPAYSSSISARTGRSSASGMRRMSSGWRCTPWSRAEGFRWGAPFHGAKWVTFL